MKNVAILAIEGSTSFSVLGSFEMLAKTSQVPGMTGYEDQEAYFSPRLVSVEDKIVKSSSGNPFFCEQNIRDSAQYDIILLPSCDGDIFQTLEDNHDLTPWLIEQHQAGAVLASVCTGAFLLAETGLMRNKRITTHWGYFPLMEQRFPDVIIERMNNIVDHGTLIAAGGGTSFIHLVMYLIERYYGHEFASLCSKFMLVDMEKVPQTVYSIFTPFKNHQNPQLLRAQDHLETNYQNRITIKELARIANMGERTFVRKFKQCTGKTPHQYLSLVRIEAAKRLVEDHHTTLQSIMYQVGYNDMSNFRQVFMKATGLSFKDYRKKFNRLVPYN